MPVTTKSQPPLLVSVVASAMSSIGIGMSLAAIWIVWLLPSVATSPPIIPTKKMRKSRRQSAPPALRPSTFQSPLQSPVPAILIAVDAPQEKRWSRHVYFLDSQARIPSPRRYHTPTEKMHDPEPDVLAELASLDPPPSPRSSSSTLTTSATPPPTLTSEQETTPTDASDSPSRPSSRQGFRFSKLIARKPRRTPGGSEGYASQSEDISTCTTVRRANTITLPAWPLTRSRRNSDVDSVASPPSSSTPRLPFRFPGVRATTPTPVPPSPTPSATASPTAGSAASNIFARRSKTHQRRPSGSVPRTQPYDYPYFATPPTLALDLQADLSDSEVTARPRENYPDTPRGRDRRQLNAHTQAALGVTRPIHKRRSASEGWINRGVSKC